MVTAADCLRKYGPAESERHMVVWQVPNTLHIATMPRKIYCNRDLVVPLAAALADLITSGHADQLRTWDGCFNIRKKRGATSQSLHSWGIAIDVNAAWNRFGSQPTLSHEFVVCFTDHGFDWGGGWRKPDGMHFQLGRLP